MFWLHFRVILLGTWVSERLFSRTLLNFPLFFALDRLEDESNQRHFLHPKIRNYLI